MNVFSDNCPITSKIDSIDETIKELNERIGKFNSKIVLKH
jgi:hypothetical protein